MIGHLGHFLLDFLAQIWTQGTLTHILGPILVIFEICQFLTIPGPFEYFSENGGLRKSKFSRMKDRSLPTLSVFILGGEVPRLNHGTNLFPIQNT